MRNRHRVVEINSSSMADIAFLLLTFFLVTTVIDQPKGILIALPAFQADPPTEQVNDRNVFAIQINSMDQIMIEGEGRAHVIGLRQEIRQFVLNNGVIPTLSDSPQSAIVSIKTDRGTSYKAFISVLDEAQAGYFEIYGERAGLSADQFRKLDLSVPSNRQLYDEARRGLPMNISIAEPTRSGTQ